MRDYQAEIEGLIKEATQGSGWAAPIVAKQLFEQLEAEDPELLQGWLQEMALPLLTKAVGDYVRAQRAEARRNTKGKEFRDAVAAHAAGDENALSVYLATHVVGPGHTRKRACDMTGPEHLKVGQWYERAGVESLTMGSFHVAVAARVGNRRTREVFSQQQYEDMYRSTTEVRTA